MNLQLHPSSAQRDGLNRLSDAELEALRLLAEGHTAKSIATLTGQSVGTINERLRQARRKTGAPSSRELARLVKAQKVGNEKIGMASAMALDHPSAARRVTDARRWKLGGIVMSIILVGGIAALLTVGDSSQEPAPSVAGSDEVLGSLIETSTPSPRQLHFDVRTEKRDESWAPRIESELKAGLSDVPRIGGASNPVRVICGSSLCEVAGIIDADPKTNSKGLNATMLALQTGEIQKLATALRLNHVASGFGQTRDRKPNYFVYLRRKQ